MPGPAGSTVFSNEKDMHETIPNESMWSNFNLCLNDSGRSHCLFFMPVDYRLFDEHCSNGSAAPTESIDGCKSIAPMQGTCIDWEMLVSHMFVAGSIR